MSFDHDRFMRDFHKGPSWGFRLWFAFCVLLGLAGSAGLIYLIVVAAQWIGRH